MSYLFTNGRSQLLYGKTATVTGVRPKFLRFGELDINKDQVAGFYEKPEYTGNYVNGGFFVFNRLITLKTEMIVTWK